MNKPFLIKPPSFINNFFTSLDSPKQISTFRTRQTKTSDFTKNLVIEHPIQQSKQPLSNFNQKLCSVISSSKYSSRPVSIVSIWGQDEEQLEILISKLTLEYQGWLQEQYQPHFSIFSGQKADTFILLKQLKSFHQTQLLFQYLISSVIFILIKEDDKILQNKIIKLCQIIGDTIYYDASIESRKPTLVICKILTLKQNQYNWNSFVRQINSWRHFISIEFLEIPANDLKSHHDISQATQEDEQKHIECCIHFKQTIRRKSVSQIVMDQVITGSLMKSIIEQIQISLSSSTYTNILTIFQKVIDEEKEHFFIEYGEQFQKLLNQKLSNPYAFRRLELYKQILECRKEATKYFNNFETTGNQFIAKQAQNKCIFYNTVEINQKRKQRNQHLFELLRKKYLSIRPVSFSRYKKMNEELFQHYINDGQLEDLNVFLLEVIQNYGNQLAYGDQLNGLNNKDNRIEQLMKETAQEIRDNDEKLSQLKTTQFVRLLLYHQKIGRVSKKITKRQSIKQMNDLEELITEKMEGYAHKIHSLKDVVQSLERIDINKNLLGLKQQQYSKKLSEIQILQRELSRIEEQEEMERRRKAEEAERLRKAELQKSVLKDPTHRQASRQQLQQEKKKHKKKRSCGCFGF